MLVAALVHALPASADEPDGEPWSEGVSDEDRKAAHDHFQEGNRLIDLPLFDEAAAQYQAALELWPHPAFYYNLAIAQLNLVQPVQAYENLEKAMAYGPVFGEDKLRQAQEYHRRLEERLGQIEITCDAPGAEVRLDGRVLFIGPGRQRRVVLPGEHQLVAEKAGRIPTTRTLVLSSGQRIEETVVLHRPARTVTERYLPVWTPWVTLAVGAAVIAGGNYLQRRADDEAAVFNRGFGDICPRGCDPERAGALTGQFTDAESGQRNALRMYIAGGVIAATGAALLYINRERVVQRSDPEPSLSLAPLLAPGAGGLSARLRF